MDLYSAARRLQRPFRFHEEDLDREALPIGARGVIGDGHTAALVSADGAIDWLCMPRFDSPSVFARILDQEKGGFHAIRPRASFESLQRYDPSTNVLETLFEVPGKGIVRITDYMPWTGDPRLCLHEVHRRIQCVQGEVELEAIFDPRFDYGRGETRFHAGDHGIMAEGDQGERLAVVLSQNAHSHTEWKPRDAGGMEAHFRIRGGESRWLVMTWDAPRPEPIAAYRPMEHLRKTRTRWREWAHALQYEGPYRHHVIRSALLLKLLLYAPSGAMVAAPTTSLPEWIGGVRNWDYRYSWTRDSAMAIRSANLVGAVTEARDFFHFVRDTLCTGEPLEIMYTLDGDKVPTERELGHLSGYRGSSPVRIGNGAKDQIQLDTAGALLDAAWVYERGGGSLTLRAWRTLRGVCEHVCANWQKPDNGIWEPRDGVRHNVHSKLMSWVALERGAELAHLFGDDALANEWRKQAVAVHEDVCARGFDAKAGTFVAAYDHDHVDAALLLLPIHGFLPPDDERITRTIARIRDELAHGAFVHRYHVDDGVGGAEGAFVLCGFWLAEALALAGRLDEAHEAFVQNAEAANHLGLLAEEVDVSSGEPLGNFPQAFSHLGLINAAARIDRALQMEDQGRSALGAEHPLLR
ncbi:MAG: glycoside hydrolase family 15 [Sandaracinus sp.]|nr:glycoside hydrolase family 15 [Sandaracinus sp.]